jgi:cation:H+ antiporter
VITLMAFTRRYTDAAVSHVIAANIFNLLVVLGLVGLIHPLAIAPMIAHADIYVMAGASALLMPLMITSWRLSRVNGLFLVICYGGYLAFLASRLGYLAVPHLG